MAKNFHYTKEEVVSTVKKIGSGGAYVPVPSSWIGGTVKVILLKTNILDQIELGIPKVDDSEISSENSNDIIGTPGT